jgi:hypothetical protein
VAHRLLFSSMVDNMLSHICSLFLRSNSVQRNAVMIHSGMFTSTSLLHTPPPPATGARAAEHAALPHLQPQPPAAGRPTGLGPAQVGRAPWAAAGATATLQPRAGPLQWATRVGRTAASGAGEEGLLGHPAWVTAAVASDAGAGLLWHTTRHEAPAASQQQQQ